MMIKIIKYIHIIIFVADVIKILYNKSRQYILINYKINIFLLKYLFKHS